MEGRVALLPGVAPRLNSELSLTDSISPPNLEAQTLIDTTETSTLIEKTSLSETPCLMDTASPTETIGNTEVTSLLEAASSELLVTP